jgi:hypothetical protein
MVCIFAFLLTCVSPFLINPTQFAAMAISDVTPLPEPKAEEKPSEDENPDGEKKMSKSQMKKLAKGKVRLVVLPVYLYLMAILLLLLTPPAQPFVANRARRTRKISQRGPSQAKRRKEKLPQRNLRISIRHPKAKRKICRCYQWTTVTIRRL